MANNQKLTPGKLSKMFQEQIPEYIGTYTYPNGSVFPAIAIDNIPNDVEVEGFEIFIPGFPRLSQGVNKSTRRTHRCELWDIEFINHDSNKPGSLARKGDFYQMIDLLSLLLPRISSGVPFQQQEPFKSLQRYRLTIKHSDAYDNVYPR